MHDLFDAGETALCFHGVRCVLHQQQLALEPMQLRLVADYNTTLSSDSLETGTGSSNSLRSTIQSIGFCTFWRIASGKHFRQMRYERPGRIKAEYDPDNFFRVNQNIKPAAPQ